MSELLENEAPSIGQTPDIVVRTFNADVGANAEERIIEGLVVPFNVPTDVADYGPHGPGPVYKEEVSPGAFRAAVNAPNRVLLDFEHYGAIHDAVGSHGSIAGTLGHALRLAEQEDGLYGEFKVLRGSDGDKALELAREGILGGFSVAMKMMRSVRSPNGVVKRVKAHIDRVSLCRVGAYEEAKVMAVRSKSTMLLEDEEMPLAQDPELALRLSRFIDVPKAGEMLLRAFAATDEPWDGAAVESALSAEEYCQVSMVDNNAAGSPKTKAQCHFPIRKTPGGPIIPAALRAIVGGRGAQAQFAGAADAIARAKRLLAQYENQQGGN